MSSEMQYENFICKSCKSCFLSFLESPRFTGEVFEADVICNFCNSKFVVTLKLEKIEKLKKYEFDFK